MIDVLHFCTNQEERVSSLYRSGGKGLAAIRSCVHVQMDEMKDLLPDERQLMFLSLDVSDLIADIRSRYSLVIDRLSASKVIIYCKKLHI